MYKEHTLDHVADRAFDNLLVAPTSMLRRNDQQGSPLVICCLCKGGRGPPIRDASALAFDYSMTLRFAAFLALTKSNLFCVSCYFQHVSESAMGTVASAGTVRGLLLGHATVGELILLVHVLSNHHSHMSRSPFTAKPDESSERGLINGRATEYLLVRTRTMIF